MACHRRPSLSQRNSDRRAKPGGRSRDQRKLSIETKPVKNSHRLPISILLFRKRIVNVCRNKSPGLWDNISKGYMSGLVQIGSQPAKPTSACAPVRRSQAVLWLQTVTLAWMLIECGVSLYAAATAHSPSLLAFGSDSLVELLSAAVVLLQIRVTQINF